MLKNKFHSLFFGINNNKTHLTTNNLLLLHNNYLNNNSNFNNKINIQYNPNIKLLSIITNNNTKYHYYHTNFILKNKIILNNKELEKQEYLYKEKRKLKLVLTFATTISIIYGFYIYFEIDEKCLILKNLNVKLIKLNKNELLENKNLEEELKIMNEIIDLQILSSEMFTNKYFENLLFLLNNHQDEKIKERTLRLLTTILQKMPPQILQKFYNEMFSSNQIFSLFTLQNTLQKYENILPIDIEIIKFLRKGFISLIEIRKLFEDKNLYSEFLFEFFSNRHFIRYCSLNQVLSICQKSLENKNNEQEQFNALLAIYGIIFSLHQNKKDNNLNTDNNLIINLLNRFQKTLPEITKETIKENKINALKKLFISTMMRHADPNDKQSIFDMKVRLNYEMIFVLAYYFASGRGYMKWTPYLKLYVLFSQFSILLNKRYFDEHFVDKRLNVYDSENYHYMLKMEKVATFLIFSYLGAITGYVPLLLGAGPEIYRMLKKKEN
ncbi:hypothetical protein ABK040_013392 [Willaertia magna]